MNIDTLQKVIHRLEAGGGLRYFRISSIALLLFGLVFVYDYRAYKNMGTMEAMDSAQLARNIAQGKGYTTLFVRPFSLYLIQKHNEKNKTIPLVGNLPDPGQIRDQHPDIANPPVYPVVLAGLMTAFDFAGGPLKFEYAVPTTAQAFWTLPGGLPGRYKPDFIIAVFNQFLFVMVVLMTFFLARRLFDKNIAWLSAVLLLGTELLWRFSSSGLSTMLLLLLFEALVWCIVLLEEELREPRAGRPGAATFAATLGLLVGAGALTRYSYAWMIVPVAGFLLLAAGQQRLRLAAVTVVTFALVVTPWIWRNVSVSGTPLGVAGYTLAESSAQFPEHRLQRSVLPDFSRFNTFSTLKDKFITGSRRILQNDLPKLGGSWLSAFLLAGLLVAYQNPAVRRLRLFLVASLLMLVVVQGLGRTQLSEDSPEVNSENLLVLLTPVLVIYGSNLFFLFLEQVNWVFRELRYIVIGAFALLACLPFIFTIFGFNLPLAYPPYFPKEIQNAASWVSEDELTMSDIPWAMAWYGQSQSVWLTLNSQSDFFGINDPYKSVQELYLTSVTLDSHFQTRWLQGGQQNWGAFVLGCVFRPDPRPGPPAGFPLPFWQQKISEPDGTARQLWPSAFLLTAHQQPVR